MRANIESAHVNLTVRRPLTLLRKADAIVVPGIDDLARSIPDAVGPLLLWIEQNLRNDLSLPVVARRAAMSGRTLSRRFREHVGMTPAAWIARARVREAQRLLETTQLSVEAVAEKAGYGSATVLRDRFAAIVGVSPLAHRRSFSSRS